MKKLSTAVLALALLASSPAMAVTRTATLVISGSIPENCTLIVEVTGNTGILNLTAPQNAVHVGNVITRCNNFNGYSLSVGTANASQLKAAGGVPPVNYTMNLVKFQGNAINSGGFFPADSNNLDIPQILDTTEQRAKVLVNTTNSASYPGIYSDTLTFTLQTL
jgi:hypothetical protein